VSRRHARSRSPDGSRLAGIHFSAREKRDLLVAWLALGAAFAIFFAGGADGALQLLSTAGALGFVTAFVVSLVTAGLGFLLHELAHKVTAIRFDHVAEFRADNSMLFLAVMSAMLGFIFAAPGAVYHRGRNVTKRENGLIALAGPVVNLGLGAVFLPLVVAGALLGNDLVFLIGQRGLMINLFLAAFNLIPFGPLDGKTVIGWNPVAWGAVFLPTVALTLLALVGVGF
jgi:Zn-dependent protease